MRLFDTLIDYGVLTEEEANQFDDSYGKVEALLDGDSISDKDDYQIMEDYANLFSALEEADREMADLDKNYNSFKENVYRSMEGR